MSEAEGEHPRRYKHEEYPEEDTIPFFPNYIILEVIVSYLVLAALVVPNFEKLESYAKSNGILFQGVSDLIKNPKILAMISAEVERATPSLAPYEKIKKILILDREFEIEKEEITPTLKVKRNIIETKYKNLIDGLYTEDQENKV